jgi:hypothetical protein
MQMTRRLTSLTVLLAIAFLPLAASVSAQGQGRGNPTDSLAIPIVGSGAGLAFTGVFNLQRFVERDGVVSAVGTLVGTVTNATGGVTSIVRNVALPVTVGQTTCDILHLDLGPLSIDLLGLQIDLSRVVLDIVAEAGAGNLLGNLLCAVAGLLDRPGGLARLLNQILDVLG